MTRSAFLLFTILAAATSSFSQGFPNKIRGYKVHEEKIKIRIAGSSETIGEKEVVLSIGKPQIESIGILGAEVSISPTANGLDRSGKVEIITFKDLTINGVAASVADYDAQFYITPDREVVVPKPFRVTIAATSIAKAAYRELVDPKKKWRIKGTAFIFGRFKKFGFSFKRVVPVVFDLTIDNPLRT